MIVVIPFCNKDAEAAIRLIGWIGELGRMDDHDCLLVVDAAVSWGIGFEAIELANKSFRCAKLITNEQSVAGWIPGANSLFFTAAEECQKQSSPWLWLEPDAVPLKSGWLDAIASTYSQCGKPFMGHVYHCDQLSLPRENLSGIAVYPHDASARLRQWKDSPLAFDIACSYVTVPDAAHTGLIQHYWGDGMPPINPGAVVFHRDKVGSIVNQLREKLFGSSNRFVIVLPFCNKDIFLLHRNLEWMIELGGCPNDEAMLAFDSSPSPEWIRVIQQTAVRVFKRLSAFRYPAPRSNQMPFAANHAFRCVAAHMKQRGRPWLWMEPDMIPLKRGWSDLLQSEYARHKKPFFGPVVPDMGHINGGAIYPPETFAWCPSISNDNGAFDMLMRDEVHSIGVHDAMNLMFHSWVEREGRLCPHGHGEHPTFPTIESVRRIPESAVLFHRVKDTSLIERLREMRR